MFLFFRDNAGASHISSPDAATAAVCDSNTCQLIGVKCWEFAAIL